MFIHLHFLNSFVPFFKKLTNLILDSKNVSNIQSKQGFRLNFNSVHWFCESGATGVFYFPPYSYPKRKTVTIVVNLLPKSDWKGVTNWSS